MEGGASCTGPRGRESTTSTDADGVFCDRMPLHSVRLTRLAATVLTSPKKRTNRLGLPTGAIAAARGDRELLEKEYWRRSCLLLMIPVGWEPVWCFDG